MRQANTIKCLVKKKWALTSKQKFSFIESKLKRKITCLRAERPILQWLMIKSLLDLIYIYSKNQTAIPAQSSNPFN